MSLTILNSEDVLQHHLQALGQNDLEELLKDYTEESELWTQNGIISGLDNISSFLHMHLHFFQKINQIWK